MTPPKTSNKVRAFIDSVSYHMDMLDIRSYLLKPLTEFTSNQVKFKWNEMEQKWFDDVKSAFSHNTLLAYTDFKKLFDIHRDASNYQLGAVISQGEKNRFIQP